MPNKVCRILWRKGHPLSLSISPKTGFLDLPRELRDQVYRYSLCAPEPVVVWSGRRDHYSRDYFYAAELTMEDKAEAISNLSLSLLLCNKQVHDEAASMLYHNNTFHFRGEGCWSPLYVFLQMIGDMSRDCLRNLELHVQQPLRLWQHADGTRTCSGCWYNQLVIPQCAYIQRGSPPFVPGYVDHVDPAIDACFRILGKKGPPLSLVLRLDEDFLPGVTMLAEDPITGYNHNFSLDLPVAIEKCRQELTTDVDGTSRVEVLWKGECRARLFATNMTLIRDKGWEILEVNKGKKRGERWYTLLFTLRRK